jgi:hypothetical protein
MSSGGKSMHKSEAFTCSADLSNVRSICTSDQCPMSQLLHAMPSLCEPPPSQCHSKRQVVEPKVLAELEDFAKIKAYEGSVWGPAKWTALESEILTLPEEIDQHEFCMFKTYLALNARYLPCGNCSRHFAEHLANMPNTKEIRTRAGLLRWLTMVHNDVNKRKHAPILSHAQIIATLEDKAQKKTTHTPSAQESGSSAGESTPLPESHLILLLVLLAILVVAFVWFLVKRARRNRR